MTAPLATAVRETLALIAELIEVAEEENALLARGMPAAIAGIAERKARLAARFEEAHLRLVGERDALAAVEPQLLSRLFSQTRVLRTILAENVTRLQAARDASRRRIELVMQAVRSEIVRPEGYGADGRRTLRPSSPHAFARIDA